MALSMKRDSSNLSLSTSSHRSFKKPRISLNRHLNKDATVLNCGYSIPIPHDQILLTRSSGYYCSSSEEEDQEDQENLSVANDNDDEDLVKTLSSKTRAPSLANKRKITLSKNKRCAGKNFKSMPSNLMNIELSRAISLYSDEDEEVDKKKMKKMKKKKSKAKKPLQDNQNCVTKVPSLLSVKDKESEVGDDEENGSSSSSALKPTNDQIDNNNNNNNNMSSSCSFNSKQRVPDYDRVARSRCFEYLVGAIDEAWARYCDATSYAEEETYGYDSPNTPTSISISDGDENESSCSGNNETEITDYDDSDFNDSKETTSPTTRYANVNVNKYMASGSCSGRVTGGQKNQHQSLQDLKDRLTNAKYYLQDFVDSDDYEDCIAFWKRWDMIKYCTIELVEDDDEDDIVENTIDELEEGRYHIVN
ncbi:hypothetical protein PACTADRAFT_32736 [Pachysolen tannophilus NRRL Y-2460]|uniref:Uncharacterized protein n=1 Tax=Pachysolen tannophilus NRRL Y-2460 TaxID=669874 RepID=A0A1E4TZT3_PACTA|nr:hypothetical protein PACTADRAFT_32736 [Pachysolen tannophilus NRRL Y-2460]